LIVGEKVREIREDATGQRDIAGFHGDARVLGEGLDNGEERVGGERWSFVRLRVDDGGNLEHEFSAMNYSRRVGHLRGRVKSNYSANSGRRIVELQGLAKIQNG